MDLLHQYEKHCWHGVSPVLGCSATYSHLKTDPLVQIQVNKILGFGSMGMVYFGVLWDTKASGCVDVAVEVVLELWL